ncbi:MAG: metalloregulator ArsR/SmtB family transcription factor [Rhodocyclaceae bacterium]|nr:metalloregulator ArsR/SmtB family transcription factor [Rhodocyclaceae bacterium]
MTGWAKSRAAACRKRKVRKYFIIFAVAFGFHTVDIITDLIEKQEHIETAARALKAISHPLRLKILCVIGDQEACVQEIVDAVGTSQSNISQHLAILRDKGVLLTRKDANRVFYRVGDQRTLQLIVLMREVFCGEPPPFKR